MFEGELVAICIADAAKSPMKAVRQVEARPGQGLVGDRYSNKADQKGGVVKPAQEVTLIEQEALEAVQRDYQLAVCHADTRRNLLTVGVPLNHLVERTFQVGEVVLQGVKLCEPCGYLESQVGQGTERAFYHRGGLRAQVLQPGTIQVGDTIRLHSH